MSEKFSFDSSVLYLLILFLSSLRSDKRSFLMYFFVVFQKKRVNCIKKGCNVTTF